MNPFTFKRIGNTFTLSSNMSNCSLTRLWKHVITLFKYSEVTRHVQQFTPWYSVWDATIDVDKAPNNRWARKFEIFWCEITSLLGLGKIAAKLLLWTHFKPMLHFYIPWKHEKTSGFLMFQGIKNKHWLEIDLFWCACVSFL